MEITSSAIFFSLSISVPDSNALVHIILQSSYYNVVLLMPIYFTIFFDAQLAQQPYEDIKEETKLLLCFKSTSIFVEGKKKKELYIIS